MTFNFAEQKITIPISIHLSLSLFLYLSVYVQRGAPFFAVKSPKDSPGPVRNIIRVFCPAADENNNNNRLLNIHKRGGSGRTRFPPATTIFPVLLLLARWRSVRAIGDTSYY